MGLGAFLVSRKKLSAVELLASPWGTASMQGILRLRKTRTVCASYFAQDDSTFLTVYFSFRCFDQWPGMMAVLMSPPRFSMWRRTCWRRDSGASPVM